jgi:integrase
VPLANYLKRRGATYSVRVRVPKDLCDTIGQREIVQALGRVRDPAEAKRKGAEKVQEIHARFDRLRSGARLTSEMIERECQAIAQEALSFLRTERLSGGHYDNAFGEDVDPRDDYLTDRMGNFGDALRQGDLRLVSDEAEEIISRLGAVASPGSAEWQELCRALLLTHAEIYRVERERHRGDVLATVRTPLNPMLVDAFQTARRAGTPPARTALHRALQNDEWCLEEACERFLAAHGNTWTANTAMQHRASLELFQQYARARTPLGDIDRRAVGDFKALIEKLPITHGKRATDKGRSLEEIVAEAENAGIGQRLSPKTVKRHLSSVIGLFRYAKEHGRYEGENPATGFRFPRTRRPREERPAWTPKQLDALFRSPIWSGCRSARERHLSGLQVIRDHQYFLPLLGAYSGLRLEEGCQLHVDDVGTEDGIAFLAIRPGDGKQLKSRAAVRRVPIHPALIAAGFLRHVEESRRKGSVLVFPELEGRRGGPDLRLGAAVTKAFTAYRRAIGQYEPGRDFHALRHSFTTGLEDAGVSRAIIDELTGHEGTGETSRYAKGASLKMLAKAASRLDYGFDTSHLRTSPGPRHVDKKAVGGRGV